MSDREGLGGQPGADDDLSLPKATVAKMINGAPLLRMSSNVQFELISYPYRIQNCCQTIFRVQRTHGT